MPILTAKNEIIESLSPSQYATGFRKKLSIVDNAKKHIGKELIVSFDIKDFFPSISYADVLNVMISSLVMYIEKIIKNNT